jgi:radical SAM-linked protein
MTALLRTFRRAGLQIPHTQGFHPKPKVGFGPSCPVGVESRAEYLDVELHGAPDPREVAERVRRELPGGFTLLECAERPAESASLSQQVRALHYLAVLPEGAPDAAGPVADFTAREAAIVRREREGKPPKPIDLKSGVLALQAVSARELRFSLRSGDGEGSVRPSELLRELFGAEWTRPGELRLVREDATLA